MRYLILVKRNNAWQSLNPYFVSFNKLQKQLTGIKEERIVVQVLEQHPGQSCMCSAVVTHPYHIIAVKKSETPVFPKCFLSG